jgi:hypothetical protein
MPVLGLRARSCLGPRDGAGVPRLLLGAGRNLHRMKAAAGRRGRTDRYARPVLPCFVGHHRRNSVICMLLHTEMLIATSFSRRGVMIPLPTNTGSTASELPPIHRTGIVEIWLPEGSTAIANSGGSSAFSFRLKTCPKSDPFQKPGRKTGSSGRSKLLGKPLDKRLKFAQMIDFAETGSLPRLLDMLDDPSKRMRYEYAVAAGGNCGHDV